ncbi:hypothetical protein [Rhodospirillum centenum]|uniref:Uncharacterized protein n=1 Tax=Rhodospirillum centenum (strain ATCC 51521 / SW) TaxID=414684 RepID=B6IRN4_RHOCS|nr:hypothetical protein [Rhodospirillum centenum]ACI98120.1 hypothetical protein RC1_0685 [Rhodospirillum centenum SW]
MPLIPALAALLAGVLILAVALRGLRPRARPEERLYTLAAGFWALFGAGIHNLFGVARLTPALAPKGPLATSLFGFGLLLLAIAAGWLSMSGND